RGVIERGTIVDVVRVENDLVRRRGETLDPRHVPRRRAALGAGCSPMRDSWRSRRGEGDETQLTEKRSARRTGGVIRHENSLLLREVPHPDITKADRRARIAVRLQLDRRRPMFLVRWCANVERLPFQDDVILHEYPVMECCHGRR